MQGDQGRGGLGHRSIRYKRPYCYSKILLLNWKWVLLKLKAKLLIGFIESQTKLLWNLNRWRENLTCDADVARRSGTQQRARALSLDTSIYFSFMMKLLAFLTSLVFNHLLRATLLRAVRCTATKKSRIVTLGFGTARQKRVLERWTKPKPLQPIWDRAAI
jgi:hypothetical protein